MIRKWFSGVFRPDEIETDSVDTEQANLGDGDVLYFGDDFDISMEWDEANSRFVIFWGDIGDSRLFDIRSPNGPGIINGTLSVGTGTLDVNGNNIQKTGANEYNPQDVRNISSPAQGWVAYHDGSGSNTEGLAAYNGTDWISQVDGSTIA